MITSIEQALRLTEVLLWLALILQSMEFLLLRGKVLVQGVFALAATRIFLCVLLLFFSFSGFFFDGALIWALIWLLSFLILFKLRGNFNGGSDSMTMLVLTAVTLANLFPTEQMQKATLWYIAIQTCFSYFLAGISKIRNPEWRNGILLGKILRFSNYDISPFWRSLGSDLIKMKWASRGLLSFELLFPVVILDLRLAWIFLVLAVAFHFMNFWILGLNRFVWAWIAAYPALIYCVSL